MSPILTKLHQSRVAAPAPPYASPMTTEPLPLDSVLAQRLRAEARRQGVSPDTMLADAVERYLEEASTGSPAVTMQPMMHVDDVGPVMDVLEILGATLTQGSASGDWAKVHLAGADLGLLAHPPNREQGDESVELTFEAHMSLEHLETAARERGIAVDAPIAEFGFGRQLVLRATDGTRFKINELRSHIE